LPSCGEQRRLLWVQNKRGVPGDDLAAAVPLIQMFVTR
jgi:hypothetical protein